MLGITVLMDLNLTFSNASEGCCLPCHPQWPINLQRCALMSHYRELRSFMSSKLIPPFEIAMDDKYIVRSPGPSCLQKLTV